ncbi:MAG: SusC/RagA family TonB-linked outer membrane protein, partial [Bacteroidales bacterium]|nr:SusC/RagA family TonB-linked outer membrane protein [Bacteroidales bacterium]
MNRIMTLCASFLLSCIMGVSVFAQGGYEVKGVVVDAIGPVIGATVIEQGTTNGTSTGLDGDYVLTVSSADAVVEISCIGYASQTFVASQVPATVTLGEDTEFLDEVVVIGYGTVKKEDMTGSITAIKSEELNRGAMVNTQDMLKGKVPGLHIIPGDGGPGSGSTIRIRGAASLNASNDPLIVIDGVPIANDGGYGMSNPLDMINPNDIESFTVLKDASSAAIYGSRASNGVIMITTKKGKGNKPQVSYSGSMSVQQNSSKLQVMTPEEFRGFIKDSYGIYWENGQLMGDTSTPAGKAIGARLSENFNMDYQDVIFRTAFTHDHNVSVNGNVNSRMPYRASIGYTDQSGTLVGSTYDKGTADLSLSPNFLDNHLTLNLNAKGVYTYSNYADSGVVGNAAFFNPTQDPYFRNADGSIDYDTCNGYFNYGTGRGNSFAPNTLLGVGPMSQLYDRISYGTSRRFIGSAGVDYKIHGLESLKLVATASIDWSDYNNKNGVEVGSYQAWSDTENRGVGQYSKEWQMRRSTAFEAYANYNETWGIHNLDLMAGYSWQHFYGSNRNISYFNVTDEVKLNSGETVDGRYPTWKWESYLVSFYGRINYSIASKYLFTFSLRNDGSSRFSPETRWGLFPSGAFAWNIKEEGFL